LVVEENRKLPFKPRVAGRERRGLIELAAQEVFAQRGYDGASVGEIAHVAGISKAVIYDHFRSKRDLHSALLKRQTNELLAFVAERVASAGGDQRAQLEAGVSGFFEFVESHPFAWRMFFRDPPADSRIGALQRRVQRQATAAIGQLLAAGAPGIEVEPRQLEMLAESLKWAINGLAGWWYEHREVSREEVVTIAMNLTWIGLERIARGERWVAPRVTGR
jgi:AcrR family transcriptional regulator